MILTLNNSSSSTVSLTPNPSTDGLTVSLGSTVIWRASRSIGSSGTPLTLEAGMGTRLTTTWNGRSNQPGVRAIAARSVHHCRERGRLYREHDRSHRRLANPRRKMGSAPRALAGVGGRRLHQVEAEVESRAGHRRWAEPTVQGRARSLRTLALMVNAP